MNEHEQNNVTEPKVAHSGEPVVTEFDKTPLQNVADVQSQNIPESPATLPGNMPPLVTTEEVAPAVSETTPTAPEKKSSKKRNAFVMAAATVALALGIGGGVAAVSSQPKEEPVATAPAEPNAESPEETAPAEPEKPAESERWPGLDFERTDPLPDELKQYETMSPVDFTLVPKVEQLKYASWLGQYRPQFIDKFNEISGDASNAPYTLTPESDVYTVGADWQTTVRIAHNFGEGTPSDKHYNGPLDEDAILKYLIAHTAYSNTNIGIGQKLLDEWKTQNDGEALNIGTLMADHEHDVVDDFRTATDFKSQPAQVVVEGSTYPAFQVNYTDPDNGDVHATKYAIFPYIDYKGQAAQAVLSE